MHPLLTGLGGLLPVVEDKDKLDIAVARRLAEAGHPPVCAPEALHGVVAVAVVEIAVSGDKSRQVVQAVDDKAPRARGCVDDCCGRPSCLGLGRMHNLPGHQFPADDGDRHCCGQTVLGATCARDPSIIQLRHTN
eukprot:7379140-Prymnesium_polylepis.2